MGIFPVLKLLNILEDCTFYILIPSKRKLSSNASYHRDFQAFYSSSSAWSVQLKVLDYTRENNTNYISLVLLKHQALNSL